MKSVYVFMSTLLIVDTFLASYFAAFNSRHVLVVEGSDANIAMVAPVEPARQTTSEKPPSPDPEPAIRKDLIVTADGFIESKLVRPVPVTPPAPKFVSRRATSHNDFDDLYVPDDITTSNMILAADAQVLDDDEEHLFRPDEPVSRADFVRWMVRVRELKPTKTDHVTYEDVKSDHPYHREIEAATRAGYIQGYLVEGAAQKEFRPDSGITRQEFAAMYCTFTGKRARAEKLSRKDIQKYLLSNTHETEVGHNTYLDVGDVSDWAYRWVAVAHQAGALKQAFNVDPYYYDDQSAYLRPNTKMTRAEAINILITLFGAPVRHLKHTTVASN
jgi:hypothetical protein